MGPKRPDQLTKPNLRNLKQRKPSLRLDPLLNPRRQLKLRKQSLNPRLDLLLSPRKQLLQSPRLNPNLYLLLSPRKQLLQSPRLNPNLYLLPKPRNLLLLRKPSQSLDLRADLKTELPPRQLKRLLKSSQSPIADPRVKRLLIRIASK